MIDAWSANIDSIAAKESCASGPKLGYHPAPTDAAQAVMVIR
mgnify:CR=1 FL=1